jgi:glycosyltransferase involved in cell wall biosynthesis
MASPGALSVTLIGHYPPPYGGVATLMKQMEGALTEAGCRVTIFNVGGGKAEGDHVVNFDRGNRLREVFELHRAFASSESDVFHTISASYRSFWMGAVTIVLARLSRRRIVVSFVGGAFADFVGSMGPLTRAVARFILSLADALIPCNDEITRAFERLVPGKPIRRISNSFPLAGGGEGELPDAVRAFLSAHSPVVSTTGAGSHEYGLHGAVEAIGRLKDRHPRIGLVIVLTRYGSEDYETRLADAIRSGGLGESVLLTRDLPDFLALLRGSDVFLRSTLVDGDSMSVRESLLLGLPTVASATPFRPDGVSLFRPGDVDDMVRALDEALGRGRGDSLAARRESEENLGALLAVYRSVASGRGQDGVKR